MKTCTVLTEKNTMMVKPGKGNAPDAEIRYKICDSVVNPLRASMFPEVGHTQMQQ